MRLGVFHTVTANPFGGTFTIREDIFEGLATAIDGSGHELVVFTNDASAASRFPSAGVSWVNVGRLRSRALLSVVKKRVNRLASHGLLLRAPFAGDSWLDPVILDAGIDLFVNLGPDAISTAVPYVCAVFDLQHRSQPFMPEVNVRGYWERWDEQYRLNVSRAAFVINGTRAGTDEIVRLFRVPRERIVQLRLPTPGFALAAAKEPPQPRPAYLKPGLPCSIRQCALAHKTTSRSRSAGPVAPPARTRRPARARRADCGTRRSCWSDRGAGLGDGTCGVSSSGPSLSRSISTRSP
jgi:hypothetical protein